MSRETGVGVFRQRCRAWLPYWLFTTGIFAATAFLGAIAGIEQPLARLPVRSDGTPVPSVTATDLFVHNVTVTLQIAGGAVLLALPTVYLLGVNGVFFGGIATAGSREFGVIEASAVLLPHGVVELPAIWLAGAIGFRLVHGFWKVASGDRDRTPIPILLAESLAAFGVVVGLLGVAAVIEAHVSLWLAAVL